MKKLFLLFCLLILSRCATRMNIPTSGMATPETQGQGLNLQSVLGQSYKIKPSTDLRHTPVDNQLTVKKSESVYLLQEIGLANWLDLSWSAGLSTPLELGAKVQLWGAPRSSAGAGNLSFALRYGYGIYVIGDDIDSEEVRGPPNNKRVYIVEGGVPRYDAILGYRLLAPLLFWTGYGITFVNYHLNFTEGTTAEMRHEGKIKSMYFGTAYYFDAFDTKLILTKTDLEFKREQQVVKDELLISLIFGLNI